MGASFALEVQYVFQVLDFLLQFGDEGVILRADLVLADLCHDLLGSVCEFERGDRLLRVVNDWTDCSDQGRPRIASKTVLEQTSDLRVTIRYVRLVLALSQGLDDFAEAAETEVDSFELEQVLLIHDILLVNLLATGQIAEIQLAAHEHAFGIGLVGFDEQLENSV